jgi:hypothetical protein
LQKLEVQPVQVLGVALPLLEHTLALSLGNVLLGLAGLLVHFGIYLIVPQFHQRPLRVGLARK